MNPQNINMQKNVYLSDDLMVTARPWHWDQFWNYGSSRTLQRLAKQGQDGTHQKLMLFLGGSGSGKSSAARVCGMVASCELLSSTPRQKWSELPRIQCGSCEGCRTVHINEGWHRGGYHEIDGSDPDAAEQIEYVVRKLAWYRKPSGSDEIPRVLAIHEAVDLPVNMLSRLKTMIETTDRVSFILLMRDPELKKLPDPLRHRCDGGTYRFETPSVKDTEAGLQCVAKIIGLSLPSNVSKYIAEQCNGDPRKSLALLNRTRSLWPDRIAMPAVKEALAE